MKDAKNFDTRAWIVAVGIVLSAFVVLSLGICIVLYKECQEEDETDDDDLPGMKRPRFALPVAFLLLPLPDQFAFLLMHLICGLFMLTTNPTLLCKHTGPFRYHPHSPHSHQYCFACVTENSRRSSGSSSNSNSSQFKLEKNQTKVTLLHLFRYAG